MTDFSPADAEPLNVAAMIVGRFARDGREGRRVLGELLGVPAQTVRYWEQAGSIPEKYRQQIIDVGAVSGVVVTPGCFVTHLRPRVITNAAA